MKRFNVVIPKEDGGLEVHPMKEWLRQHPDRVPAGLDATSSTSHELRNGLKKMGWSVQATDGEVRLVVPGVANLESTIGAVLGDEESEEDVQPEVTFGLEYQLRDFLAQNLGAIPVEGRQLRLFVDPRDGMVLNFRLTSVV